MGFTSDHTGQLWGQEMEAHDIAQHQAIPTCGWVYGKYDVKAAKTTRKGSKSKEMCPEAAVRTERLILSVESVCQKQGRAASRKEAKPGFEALSLTGLLSHVWILSETGSIYMDERRKYLLPKKYPIPIA